MSVRVQRNFKADRRCASPPIRSSVELKALLFHRDVFFSSLLRSVTYERASRECADQLSYLRAADVTGECCTRRNQRESGTRGD